MNAQVDTRRMVETGTGSMRSTSSAVAVGDAPNPHIGTENPMTDEEILKQHVAGAIYTAVQAYNGNHSALPWRIVNDGAGMKDRWLHFAEVAIDAIASMPHSDQVACPTCGAKGNEPCFVASHRDQRERPDHAARKAFTGNVSDKE